MGKLHIIPFGLMVIILLSFGNCSSYSPIRELEVFSSELETNSSTYSVEEWKEAFRIYDGIITSMKGLQLTDDETREFGRINGVCTGYLAKGAVVIAKDASSTRLTFLDGLIEGFSSTIDDDFLEDAIESLEDNIESIIERYE